MVTVSFNSKIFIFCQIIPIKWRTCPNLAITQPFLDCNWTDWMRWEIKVMNRFLFFGKMGAITTFAFERRRSSRALPNPTKKLAHWMEFLGEPFALSWNHVFAIFMGEPHSKYQSYFCCHEYFWTFWRNV